MTKEKKEWELKNQGYYWDEIEYCFVVNYPIHPYDCRSPKYKI